MSPPSNASVRTPVPAVDLVFGWLAIVLQLPFAALSILGRRLISKSPLTLQQDFMRNLTKGIAIPLSLRRSFMLPSIDEALDSPRFAPFKDSLCERVKTPEFLGYWINKGPLGEPRKPADCDIVLLHFHGGGYVAGHPLGSLYQPLRIAEIAAQEGLSVSTFSLDYSLAPEAVFPTQQNEAVAAYKYLVSPTQMAIDPAKIIVYGESAGGHLAITLLDRLYSESIPRPGGAMLAAPWVNMHNSGQSFVRNKHLDLLHKPSVDKWAKYHVTRGQTGDNDKQTLRQLFDLSASVTESRNYLPSVTWVTVGGHEMFIDDVDLFVDNAKKAGANVVYEVVGRMPHLWQHVDMFKRKDYYKVQPGEDVGDMMKGAQSIGNGLMKVYRQKQQK